MEELTYRSILAEDKCKIQELHEQFFPVRYSPEFYENAVRGTGIRNLPLFSVVVLQDKRIVGFLLAQFFPLGWAEDKEALDIYNKEKQIMDPEVMYILTIGCIPEMRKQGLASKLVNMCVEHSANNPKCGAVYLHVLTSNQAAIRLYERNLFIFYHTRYNFYEIDGQAHSAYLYLLPLNQFSITRSLLHEIWMVCDNLVTQVGSALRTIMLALSTSKSKKSKRVEDSSPIVYGSDFA